MEARQVDSYASSGLGERKAKLRFVAPPLTPTRLVVTFTLLYRDPACMPVSEPMLCLSLLSGTLVAMAGS